MCCPVFAFRTAIIDYTNRLTTYGVSLIEHSDKTSAAGYLKQIDRQAGDSQIILLMETGQEMDSITFSESYSSWRISRSDTHLVIGPSDGFGEQGQGGMKVWQEENWGPGRSPGEIFNTRF